MKRKSYTFYIASSDSGHMRRIRVPLYIIHLLTALAIVGSVTVAAAVGSYTRMVWKVTNYNTLRHQQENLKRQYRELQTEVKDSNERLNSLQSLATQVAMTYGFTRSRQTPFSLSSESDNDDIAFARTLQEFQFLERNATQVALAGQQFALIPTPKFTGIGVVPSLWPVVGELTGRFGERQDPFSGEGAFHTGVDIASRFGDPVHATANGVVILVGDEVGYGRLVVVDHGFGVTTLYGHLSSFNAHVGMQVRRGDVIGFEGQSGRATAAHLHYEVRINNTPVNPLPYMRESTTAFAASD